MNGKQIDYKTLPGFETKTIPTFVKDVDEARGIVEHIVSVFGIVDSYDDIVMPGSFAKTIVEHGSRVRVLDQHNYFSALNIVGKPIGLREIGREELPLEVTAQYPEATGGLLATTQYALKTDNGRNMFNLVAGGYLPETSIGYDALDTEEEIREINGEKVAVRLLKTIRLWEYSNVIWGANPATATVSAKATELTEGKRVSGTTDLPIAARDRSWDAAEAQAGMRRVTGSDEEPSDGYRDGFFWYDGEASELFGSYKLPFADDVGGELTAIPRGIFAGAARLDQTDIPDADKDRVRTRMSRYYARMREQFDDDSLVPPWEKARDDEPEQKVGRAISAARIKRIRAAIDNARGALSDLEEMLAEVEPVDEDGKSWLDQADIAPDGTITFHGEKFTDGITPAPQPGAADDSTQNEAGPVTEPPTSRADTLNLLELKGKEYDILEVLK